MTVPYWFLFLAAICATVAGVCGCVGLVVNGVRVWRTRKLGVVVVPASGEFGASAGDGADTLGPHRYTTHGLRYGRRTRGLLPDSQEGRHGGSLAANDAARLRGRPPTDAEVWEI